MPVHVESASLGHPAYVDKYQRNTKEWNQVIRVLSVKGKTLKEAGEVLGTSSSTVIPRVKELVKEQLTNGVRLSKAIPIDEYKGATDAGTYLLVIEIVMF